MSLRDALTRSLSTAMVLVFGLSLFAFAPLASAAQAVTAFAPTPASEYKIHEGGNYDVTVDVSNMTDDVNVHFYVKGPLGEPGETEELIESRWYITPEDYTFVWDGKMGGNYVESGTYEIRIQGDALIDDDPADLKHQVEVEGATHFSVTAIDDPYYTTSPDGFEMMLQIDTMNLSCPRFRVGPTGDLNVTADIEIDLPAGEHTLSWDGQYGGGDAPAGEYTYVIFNDLCGDPATLTGTFMVSNDAVPASPTISGLGMTIDPFSPDGDGNQDTTTANFTLDVAAPYTDADVTVTVENSSNVEVKKLKDAEVTSAGTVNAVWDGKETGGSVVSDGTYTIKVMAANAGGSDSVETTVVVDTSEGETDPEPTDTQCAGYTDVAANHSSCDAIEYVKSLGAMTGNPDGTFAPNEVLQRDQVAKISLETHGLFDENADYCGGNNPFPDVTSSAWSYQYICRGKDLGMITGYESGADAGKYIPARSVNRVEFLALILRNLSESMPALSSTSYLDVESGQWFSGYAKFSKDNSLFLGLNLFPTRETTRAEVADVIYKLHQEGKI